MRTVAQKRSRAKVLKASAVLALFAIVFTPRLDGVDFPEVGLPLVSTAIAAPLD